MTYKSLFILGRQPALGRSELESLFGAQHLSLAGSQAMLCDLDVSDIPFSRLGGSIRVAKILGQFNTTKWPDIANQLARNLPTYIENLPEDGKLKLGLSTFDLPVDARQLFRTGLDLKKVCTRQGRSVRLVPNTEPALNSAQVIHNQLTGQLGVELLLVQDTNQTWVAQTTSVQDIDAYARRDQTRPKRDARVGMLPPKLAQIIVNLATGQTTPPAVVLDPFCGTGVILQESLLMGYTAYGTDLEPRMVEYSQSNLEWLLQDYTLDTIPYTLEPADATSHQWEQHFDVVASETYLGSPLTSWPTPDRLNEIMGNCNIVIEKFLKNLTTQTKPGLRLCLAVPAWRSPSQRLHHLKVLDHLEKLGYNRLRFEHVEGEDLVYFRPEQLVARELLVITRK